MEFDTQLLRRDSENPINIDRFTYGNSASPGRYRVDILVNDSLISNEEVLFSENDEKKYCPV